MEPTLIRHIESKPGVCGGKPCVAGTRIRVQDIFVWHEMQGKTPDEIVSDFPQLTLADVHAALAYYWDHREEIHRQMKEADDLGREHEAKVPVETPGEVLAHKGGESDPVSSRSARPAGD